MILMTDARIIGDGMRRRVEMSFGERTKYAKISSLPIKIAGSGASERLSQEASYLVAKAIKEAMNDAGEAGPLSCEHINDVARRARALLIECAC